MAIPSTSDGFWYDTMKQNSLTGQWNNQQKKDAYEGYALAQLRAKYENIGEEQRNASVIRRDKMAEDNMTFDQAFKMRQEKQTSDASKAALFTTVGGLAVQNADKLFGSTTTNPYTLDKTENVGAISRAGKLIGEGYEGVKSLASKAYTAVTPNVPTSTVGAAVPQGSLDYYPVNVDQTGNIVEANTSFDLGTTFSGLYDDVSSTVASGINTGIQFFWNLLF
jgi:hypothetical protein